MGRKIVVYLTKSNRGMAVIASAKSAEANSLHTYFALLHLFAFSVEIKYVGFN